MTMEWGTWGVTFLHTTGRMLNFSCLTYEHLRTFTSRVLRTFTSRVLRTFTSRVLRTFTSRALRTFTSRVLRTFNSRVLRTRIHSEIIFAVSPKIQLSSMKCVNLCKFVVSFPSDFTVSCTSDLLQKFREKGAAYMLVLMVLFFFFSCFELCITMYLRKFALSRIPSHHDITCFLAHWLGNFSTISLNQISSLLTLSTFQDSLNNNCQFIRTVFRSLKIELSSASMIRRRRQIINSSLENLLILSKPKSYKWRKSKKPLSGYTINIWDQCQYLNICAPTPPLT